MNNICANDHIRKLLNSRTFQKKEIGLYILLHGENKNKYLDEIISCSQCSDNKVRLVAIMVLSSINSKKIVPLLEKSLSDKLWKIRAIAAISLAKYKNDKAIPVLKTIIQNDIPDHSIHKRAIEALGKYKKDELLSIFEKMLSHRRKASKIKAIDAIRKIGSHDAFQLLVSAEEKETDGNILSRIRSAIQSFDQRSPDKNN